MRIGGVHREIALRLRSRYHSITMKRSTLKLVIRREALRVLTELALVRVAGGNPDAQQDGTGNAGTGCPFVQPAAQPAKP